MSKVREIVCRSLKKTANGLENKKRFASEGEQWEDVKKKRKKEKNEQ